MAAFDAGTEVAEVQPWVQECLYWPAVSSESQAFQPECVAGWEVQDAIHGREEHGEIDDRRVERWRK